MERLPGFRDFYPEPLPNPDTWSCDARQYIFSRWRTMAQRYGFREYDGPPLEPLELFTMKSGEEIVGQLYNFADKGNRNISLRPEMTPTLARMIAAHERNYKKPVKWFAIPQLFRYERQQRGRLREHFQFNADIIGEANAAADAELIALVIDTLKSFGLTASDFVVRLSSRTAWHEFYAARQGDLGREYEFFQIIDKLEREDPARSNELLQGLGLSLDQVKEFIERAEPTGDLAVISESLKARGLADFFKIDYQVIRGLAYYTGPVFEAFDRRGQLRAIAGGGRYDNLVKLVSGGKVDLPALGFGMGDVVLLELLKDRKLLPDFKPRIDVYCLCEEEGLRLQTLGLVQVLREAGLTVEHALVWMKPDKQFKRAQELRATYTAKVAPDAATGDLIVRARNLQTRQETNGPMAEASKLFTI